MSQDSMWLIESKAFKTKRCGSIHTRYEILIPVVWNSLYKCTQPLIADPCWTLLQKEQMQGEALRLYSNSIYSNDDDYLLVK